MPALSAGGAIHGFRWAKNYQYSLLPDEANDLPTTELSSQVFTDNDGERECFEWTGQISFVYEAAEQFIDALEKLGIRDQR